MFELGLRVQPATPTGAYMLINCFSEKFNLFIFWWRFSVDGTPVQGDMHWLNTRDTCMYVWLIFTVNNSTESIGVYGGMCNPPSAKLLLVLTNFTHPLMYFIYRNLYIAKQRIKQILLIFLHRNRLNRTKLMIYQTLPLQCEPFKQ